MKPKPVLAALGVACFKSVASAAAVDTVNSLDELPYDSSDNHLASHIFAYTSSCIQIVENSPVQDGIFSHKFYVLEGTAEEDVFGHLDSSVECKVACLEKGTPRSLVARPMPHRYWIDGMVDRGDGTVTDEISLFDFVTSDGCGMVEYGFINYLDRVSATVSDLLSSQLLQRDISTANLTPFAFSNHSQCMFTGSMIVTTKEFLNTRLKRAQITLA